MCVRYAKELVSSVWRWAQVAVSRRVQNGSQAIRRSLSIQERKVWAGSSRLSHAIQKPVLAPLIQLI